jgi:hypothetical protein
MLTTEGKEFMEKLGCSYKAMSYQPFLLQDDPVDIATSYFSSLAICRAVKAEFMPI